MNDYQSDHVPNVVAIYIVRFDTKRGNVIEWQYPEGNEQSYINLFMFNIYKLIRFTNYSQNTDFDLKGIEFQALPSGLHAVNQDIMYVLNAKIGHINSQTIS